MESLINSKNPLAAFNAPFFLSLIDDVKWRDTFGKFIQYAFRTSVAFLPDLSIADKQTRLATAETLNTAAGHISLGRRLFRFMRWTRNLHNYISDIKSYNPTAVGIVHASASIAACICEDITTLGKLGLIPAHFSDQFIMPGNYCWLTESVSGFIIHGLRLREASVKLLNTRKLYQTTKAGESDPNLVYTQKQSYLKALVALHMAQVNFTKWVCEVMAASHDSKFHSNTKLALISSLISAFVSTYSHSTKFLPKETY